LNNRVLHDKPDENLAGWAEPNRFKEQVKFGIASRNVIRLHPVGSMLHQRTFPLEEAVLLKVPDVVANVVAGSIKGFDDLQLKVSPGPLEDGCLPNNLQGGVSLSHSF
jgi:hypothetical protein